MAMLCFQLLISLFVVTSYIGDVKCVEIPSYWVELLKGICANVNDGTVPMGPPICRDVTTFCTNTEVSSIIANTVTP